MSIAVYLRVSTDDQCEEMQKADFMHIARKGISRFIVNIAIMASVAQGSDAPHWMNSWLMLGNANLMLYSYGTSRASPALPNIC